MSIIRKTESVVPRNYDANGSPVECQPALILRASGSMECTLCSRNYISHPMSSEHTDSNGESYLNILCDGTLVKL
jgi:hypothetical protein